MQCDVAVATSFRAFPQVTPVLWVLAGIVVTLGVVGLAAVITLRVRSGMCGDCLDQEDDDQHTSTGSPESLTEAGAKVSTASTGNLVTVSLQGVKGPVLVTAEEMDDRNPDVIPHTTGDHMKPLYCITESRNAYPEVPRLATWSYNCKWYSSLPLGAVVSLFCVSV
jgi:hypothetical protein